MWREPSIVEMIDKVTADQSEIFIKQADKSEYLAKLEKKIKSNFEKASESEKQIIMKIVFKSRSL